jgi:hypothetical protein
MTTLPPPPSDPPPPPNQPPPYQPPYQPAGGAGGNDRTTMWGVLGIIIGLICCGILGIVFGALSIRDAKRYGRSQVLGWVAIVLSALNILGSAALGLTGNYPGVDYGN